MNKNKAGKPLIALLFNSVLKVLVNSLMRRKGIRNIYFGRNRRDIFIGDIIM
jgi:hypothetical protein